MNRAKTPDAATAVAEKWVGTWTEVEQAQLETMLRATPAQRLAWLEEAMRLAHASGPWGRTRRSVGLVAPETTLVVDSFLGLRARRGGLL